MRERGKEEREERGFFILIYYYRVAAEGEQSESVGTPEMEMGKTKPKINRPRPF